MIAQEGYERKSSTKDSLTEWRLTITRLEKHGQRSGAGPPDAKKPCREGMAFFA
jgi:hypothetical protein